MTEGLNEQGEAGTTFASYSAPEVTKYLLKGELKLGGETRPATVLVARMMNFRGALERLSKPEEVVDLLNRYYNLVAPIIERLGGDVDQYIQADVLARFGAPTPQPDHALRAVTAALEIRTRLAEFNAG